MIRYKEKAGGQVSCMANWFEHKIRLVCLGWKGSRKQASPILIQCRILSVNGSNAIKQSSRLKSFSWANNLSSLPNQRETTGVCQVRFASPGQSALLQIVVLVFIQPLKRNETKRKGQMNFLPWYVLYVLNVADTERRWQCRRTTKQICNLWDIWRYDAY